MAAAVRCGGAAGASSAAAAALTAALAALALMDLTALAAFADGNRVGVSDTMSAAAVAARGERERDSS